MGKSLNFRCFILRKTAFSPYIDGVFAGFTVIMHLELKPPEIQNFKLLWVGWSWVVYVSSLDFFTMEDFDFQINNQSQTSFLFRASK